MAVLITKNQPRASVVGKTANLSFYMVQKFYRALSSGEPRLLFWCSVIFAATASISAPLPVAAITVYYAGSMYTTVGGLTWDEAQANARRLGGNLVTINDAAEDNWIMSQFDGLYPGAYIGLSNTDGNGFKWSSGETLSYTNWGVWTNGWQEPYYNPSLHYGLKIFTGGDVINAGVALGSWFVSDDNWFNDWHPGTSLVGIAEIKLGSGSPGGTSVPGPLPILGLAAAFGFSRKLSKRIKLHKGTSAVSTSPAA